MRTLLLFFSAFILFGCPSPKNNQTTNKVFNKTVKIILIDASGSFSKVYKQNEQNEQNQSISLFVSSCEKIVEEYLKPAKFGEQIIVRAILDDSYDSKALICNLNLTGTEFFFDKIKESGAGSEAVFEEDSADFYLQNTPKMDSIKQTALNKFASFKNTYIKKGTSRTDLCGAFAEVAMDLEQIDASVKNRELIILSDLQNNTALSRCNQFNANGLKVKVLYLSENGFAPEKFSAFKTNALERFFSKALSIHMHTPSHSE
jgi:hypothetical protein